MMFERAPSSICVVNANTRRDRWVRMPIIFVRKPEKDRETFPQIRIIQDLWKCPSIRRKLSKVELV